MSKLKIVDIDFLESELPSNSEVKGGYGLVPTVSIAYDTSVSTAYNTSYQTYVYNYGGLATYTSASAFGAAAAAAYSIGNVAYASAYSSAYTS